MIFSSPIRQCGYSKRQLLTTSLLKTWRPMMKKEIGIKCSSFKTNYKVMSEVLPWVYAVSACFPIHKTRSWHWPGVKSETSLVCWVWKNFLFCTNFRYNFMTESLQSETVLEWGKFFQYWIKSASKHRDLRNLDASGSLKARWTSSPTW